MYSRDSDRRNAIKPAPLKIDTKTCFMCPEKNNLNNCDVCKIYFCTKCAYNECLICNNKLEIRNSNLVKVKYPKKFNFCIIL